MTRSFRILEFSNYDGDSFDLTLDLGFDLVIHRKCRLAAVDTPELRGGTDDSKAAARLARDQARGFVSDAMDTGFADFLSETYTGKFGRPLGDIVDHTGASLRAWLLLKNLAVPYDGEAKSEIQALHDANIAALKARGEI